MSLPFGSIQPETCNTVTSRMGHCRRGVLLLRRNGGAGRERSPLRSSPPHPPLACKSGSEETHQETRGSGPPRVRFPSFLLPHQLIKISDAERIKVGSVGVETTVRGPGNDPSVPRRSAERKGKWSRAPIPALAQPPGTRAARLSLRPGAQTTVTQH